jgi:hypothetical protein
MVRIINLLACGELISMLASCSRKLRLSGLGFARPLARRVIEGACNLKTRWHKASQNTPFPYYADKPLGMAQGSFSTKLLHVVSDAAARSAATIAACASVASAPTGSTRSAVSSRAASSRAAAPRSAGGAARKSRARHAAPAPPPTSSPLFLAQSRPTDTKEIRCARCGGIHSLQEGHC